MIARLLLLVSLLLPSPLLAQGYDMLVLNFTLTNSAQTVKAAAGPIILYSCYNPNATVTYVQVYNTTGAVTVGTTVADFSIALGPSQSSGLQSPRSGNLSWSASAGIKAAATTTATGAGAPTTAVTCDFAIR